MLKFKINGIQTKFSKWALFQYTTATKTAKHSESFTKYLINSLGFSKDEAFITCSKVSSFKSIENPNLVINFFESKGLSQPQIKYLVSKEPRILSCNVDKTLKPKFDAFTEMGFSGSDVTHVLTACPYVFRRSLNDHLIPTLGILKSLFSSNDNDNVMLINAIKSSSWLLGPSAKKSIPDVIPLLQSYGLTPEQVKTFAIRKTRYLSLGSKAIEPILIRVEKLGIPRGTPMFYHGICALCGQSESNLESRVGIYKKYGFTDNHLLTLGRKNPYALLIPDPKLSKCLDFFMNEVGYEPIEIATAPYILTLSLEKRVIPRYKIWKGLKEKGLLKGTKKNQKEIGVSSATCWKVSEARFFEKYVEPFKNRCPDLYSEYVKVARPVLVSSK